MFKGKITENINGKETFLISQSYKKVKEEPDVYGFIVGVCLFFESLVFALWINQNNIQESLIWALPICVLFAYCGLYALNKSNFKKAEDRGGNVRR